MENWCYEPKLWHYFATHYQTEIVTYGICKKSKKAQFSRRIATMRQLSFGLLDMDGTVKIQQQLLM
jgi:Zn-dependent oligopeptidase